MKKYFKKIIRSVVHPSRVLELDYPLYDKAIYPKKQSHQGLYTLTNGNITHYKTILAHSLLFTEPLTNIQNHHSKDPLLPFWNNHFLPGLDIVLLYTLLGYYHPHKYVEIGSGISTRVAKKFKKEQSADLEIICIDPQPRKRIDELADQWIHQPLQEVDLQLFRELKKNDIVFFDGTHLLMPNSDVTWFFLEVLPVLEKGVIVQIHDIYIPFDYPGFMIGRNYNENYILGAVLLSNPERYEIIAPAFFMSEHAELPDILRPFWEKLNYPDVERHGGSFYFQLK